MKDGLVLIPIFLWSKAMDCKKLDWWLSLLGNLGVLGGLVFVGLEIRQNTSQLRVEASQTITASVKELNAGVLW